MTRKDFQFIADVIRELPASMREEVAQKFARELPRTNGGFKPERFLRACGVETSGGRK